MILRKDINKDKKEKIFSRLKWQQPQQLQLPKKEPIGIGSLGYHISLSEQDDFIHIRFLAKPLRSDSDITFEWVEDNMKISFDERGIALVIKNIEDFLYEHYPEPENYFNKIEPIQETSNEKILSIACEEVRGVHMTREYLKEAFQKLTELLEDVIRSPQVRQQITVCTLF